MRLKFTAKKIYYKGEVCDRLHFWLEHILWNFNLTHIYLDVYPLDFDKILRWHDFIHDQLWLRQTPTLARPVLVKLNKRRFLSLFTCNMKNTFHQRVTWDKPQHNYIVTISQHLITKILSKTYVEHFVVKTQTFTGWNIFGFFMSFTNVKGKQILHK